MSKSNGFSKLPHGFHKRINELNESRLKVWLAHRCMEGKQGTSYPGLDTLVQYTGLNIHTVTNARKWLRDNGWLVSTGQVRATHGKFSVPTEHTEVPPITVGGNPANGTVGGLAASGPTASRPTASGPAASGNPTIEVDPVFEVDPIFEVDPKKEVHPSNPPPRTDDGMAGSKNPSEAKPKTAGREELTLTEEVMRERLQRAHAKIRTKHNDTHSHESTLDFYGVPLTPNLTGCKELFEDLCARGITRVDQMSLVCAAYESWFECKYLLSFEDHDKAEEKASYQSDKNIYIPEPIRCPLVVFRKEIPVYLDEAREQLDEEAEVKQGEKS